MPGMSIGPYQLDALLGRGGMGEVYRALDARRDRMVALKLLHSSLSADDEFRRRFRRESAVVTRLTNPHVIPVHDYGEIDGRLFIDMHLVDGRDLDALLAAEGPFAALRAVWIVEQVAIALDAAHDVGLIHRDVKPSNILLGPKDFAYLGDFGIAWAAGSTTSLTVTGAAIGTLRYMAPERFANEPQDRRVDVYALACVLFELITGEPAFGGKGLAQLMYAHLNAAPPRFPPTCAVPESLNSVLARGVAKRAGDRYASAGELARAARQAVTERPVRGNGAAASTIIGGSAERSHMPTYVPRLHAKRADTEADRAAVPGSLREWRTA